MATLFAELSQKLRGAPSSALLAVLFERAAPRSMKVDIWARLRGQQAQLTIQVQIVCQTVFQHMFPMHCVARQNGALALSRPTHVWTLLSLGCKGIVLRLLRFLQSICPFNR